VRLLRCGKELCQFPEIVGGGGEEEFVVCTAWAAWSKSAKSENAFEVGKEHLDLLPEFHRDVVLTGLGDVAGDLARVGVRAAFGFGGTDLTDVFQGALSGGAFAGRSSVGVGVVASELLERMAFWADVPVFLGIPFEVRPSPIVSTGLVEDRDVRGPVP